MDEAPNKQNLIKVEVPESFIGERADVSLFRMGFISSRAQSQKLFKAKCVLKKDKAIRGSYLLEKGDVLYIPQEPEVTDPMDELIPYDFPLDVVFEDKDLLVVNKPSGLVVHPAFGHNNDTLVNALVARQVALSPGSAPHRPGLVHRLDKNTSGLLVIAKNETSHSSLAKQFKNRTTKRIYWAVVFGKFKEKTGTIETYLDRHPVERKKFTVCKEGQGKLAITNYEVLEEAPELSLVQLKLDTGRTHQIRVHLSSMGNAICGDDVYGGLKRANGLKNQKLKKIIKNLDRFALHAKTLGFCHPGLHEVRDFECDIPQNLTPFFQEAGLGKWI